MADPYDSAAGNAAKAADVGGLARDRAAETASLAADQAADVAGHASAQAGDVASHAANEASLVRDTAAEAGGQVLDTAKESASEVIEEAREHGRRLIGESVDELKTQAANGQQKLAEIVRSLTDELQSMVSAGDPQGPVTQLAGSIQDVGDRTANWLQNKGPEQVIDDVRRYAARNPMAFLAAAAGIGLVGSRLVRGLRDARPVDVSRPTHLDAHRPASVDVNRPFVDPGAEASAEGMADYRDFGTHADPGPGASA